MKQQRLLSILVFLCFISEVVFLVLFIADTKATREFVIIYQSLVSGIFLLLLFWYYRWQQRAIKRLSKIRENNRDLKIENRHLKESSNKTEEDLARFEEENESLNFIKEGRTQILIDTIKVATESFYSIEEYRQKLLEAFKKGDTQTLGLEINNPELIKEVYRKFYQKFDESILRGFPAFPKFYNKEVPVQYRVKEGIINYRRPLNMRMRIFGLRKIGIKHPADIARILNVSQQTVYNVRTELGFK